jgi:ATP/maltotriose-dependent transcriptional regulator MalT/DNA-binding SARP family transcriptional activator
LPASHVARPALERLLDEAERRRLTSIVAGPGFGKSTLAASVATERGWHWYLLDGGDHSVTSFARGLADALELDVAADGFTGSEDTSRADVLAAVLTQALEEQTASDQVLVLDDVHELGRDGASVNLLERLVRQAPPELHLVLASRDEPPFPIDRLRGQGQVLDIDASMLTFSAEEAGGVVGTELGNPIYELTAGWPAAVQLTAEMLQSVPGEDRGRTLAELGRRGDRLVSYLAQEVLEREPHEVRQLLRIAAEFDRFSAELCEAVGAAPQADLLTGLQRRGLIASRSGPGGWLTLHAVLREFVRENISLDETARREVHLSAARWFGSQGLHREALASLKIAGDPQRIADFFKEHWRPLIEWGFSDAVVDAAELLTDDVIDEPNLHNVGRSYALLGRTGEALAWFEKLPPGPDRAFQIADVHMQRGEPAEAWDVLIAGMEAETRELPNGYVWIYLAFLAPTLGELDVGEDAARRALEQADAIGYLGHQADAHAAVADVAQARGDVEAADRHYRAARELAERARNLLALCSVQIKTARLWTVQGRYEDALAMNDAATELADRIGFAQMRSEGRHGRALVYARLGRFDEAGAEVAEALALDELADRAPAWNLVARGDLESERGEIARARIAYTEALEMSHPRQVRLRSIALGGLARALAGDDPDRAAELAAEAVELCVNERPAQLLAAGWVALRRGEHERAATLADDAAEEATRRRARHALAESLELRAFCSAEAELGLLEDALALRRELGEPVGAARVALALARLSGATLEAERIERELRRLGFRDTAGRMVGVLMAAGTHGPAPLALQTLGSFRVLRKGEPVPSEAWKSKKARDLLKMLAARRGKPVARDQAIEALWPEEDPGATGNRLSVALSTLRSVLDPDRELGQDHYVVAADGALRLSLEAVTLDVQSFLDMAESGLRAWRERSPDEAIPQLEIAEEAYTGDFLEEDRYQDWAEPLRNEARTVYIEVLRALGESTQAIRYFLRIIDRDPYDESAHLGLVTALRARGAHGEARRAYGAYVSRMRELSTEPAPFPPQALSPG